MSAKRLHAALAGHLGDEPAARELLADPAPAVRATALTALARMRSVTEADLARALSDADAPVRRRACEVAATLPGHRARLRPLLGDADPTVAETAAWALGEREEADPAVVDALAAMATDHADALCREAAVAALGAIGQERGLPAILAATGDRATVRRRAVIALAPFGGPEVDAALARARADRDWQVRQAAEDLLAEDG